MTPHQPPTPDIRPASPGPAALTINALGKKCPIPIIMLAERIREVAIGEMVEVLADDPAAESDLPAWCRLKSQEHVLTRQLPEGWSFLVRRCY
ncbi:MAG TPA: sulfurtransferase TusA family protein [Streptosporangiaceae bacterium]|nr:sulfurtransferase TusA family protein [Streptosporangiaceae bacterium]